MMAPSPNSLLAVIAGLDPATHRAIGPWMPGSSPRWVDYLLVPLVNLAVALLLSGLIVIAIGANPIDALDSLVFGAVGYPEAVGFTLDQ